MIFHAADGNLTIPRGCLKYTDLQRDSARTQINGELIDTTDITA
jgi:hypothetical protein